MQEIVNIKPTFNVIGPFVGTYLAQLNKQMNTLLQQFISQVDYVEEELEALKNALRDPQLSGFYDTKAGPSFVVVRSFYGVVLIEMNVEMRDLIVDFINDIDGGVDKIIWAFKLALLNPGGRRVKSDRSNRNTHINNNR